MNFETHADDANWRIGKESANPWIKGPGWIISIHRRDAGFTASISRAPYWNPSKLRETFPTVWDAKAAAWKALTTGDAKQEA
jgi:hypothetical protein